MIEFFQVILPLLVGISLGLIGGGGTVLAVPILIYIFQQEPKSAIGMSLGIVSLVSLTGSYSHWKKGNVRLGKAAIFTPFAMIGATLGAKISHLPIISSKVQLILFGITVLISSVFMIQRKPTDEFLDEAEDSPTNEVEISGHFIIPWTTLASLAIQGLFVGILTGLVGVGGGFLIVPALLFVGKLPIKEAIGTSLVIIFFNSMSGFLGYVGKVEMDWGIMAGFLGLSLIGVFLGVHYGEKVPKQNLQKIFGVFLFIMGIWLVYSQI